MAAAAVAAAAVGLRFLLCLLSKKTIPCAKKFMLTGAFAGYFFLIAVATIFMRPPIFHDIIELNPAASYIRAANTKPQLACIEIRNLVLNAAMFVPLGFMLPMFHARLANFYKILTISLLASFSIEITQLLTHRGVFSIEDMLHNTAGAALGYIFFKIFKKA